MVWGHLALYVLYAVGSGAKRARMAAVKISKGAYGRARQAASRVRASDDRPLDRCPVCRMVYMSEYAVRDHVLNVHPDDHCRLYHDQPCRAHAATVAYLGQARIGLDPSGPAGGHGVSVAVVPSGFDQDRDSVIIQDRSGEIMQRLGINATEALERAAEGVRAFRDATAQTGAGLAAHLADTRRAQQEAAAEERITRMRAQCPLSVAGGCQGDDVCDVHGACAARQLIDAYEQGQEIEARQAAAPCTVCGAEDHARLAHTDRMMEIQPDWHIHASLEEYSNMIQSPERPSDEIVADYWYPNTNLAPEDADGPAEPRETGICAYACTHSVDEHTESGCIHIGCPCRASYGTDVPNTQTAAEILDEWQDESEERRVVLEGDPDYNDLQTYLEGGTLESTEAAKRLDQRAVDAGQLSPKTFWDTWDEEPRRTHQAHKLWCARWSQHHYSKCPVWGAE